MIKMLIVDDETEICDFLREFFVDRGYDVITAFSGEEALEKIEDEPPHILLLDITMPGISGLDVLKSVRENHSGMKVIMVTAVETSDQIDEAFRLGADNYITKPLSLEYLENDVKEKISKLT